jgi:hypothetical protein
MVCLSEENKTHANQGGKMLRVQLNRWLNLTVCPILLMTN